MSDRALQICIGLSLAIHLIASVGLSGDRWSTPVLTPPAPPPAVRVRLAGPPAAKTRETAALPSVSAAKPRPRPERAERAEPKPKPAEVVPAPAPDPVPETVMEPAPNEAVETELAALDVSSPAAETSSHGGGTSDSVPDALPGHGQTAEEEENLLARYVEEIRARIQRRKHYPPLARKRSVEGRVIARVAIRADGRLTSVEFDPTAPPLLRRATDDAIRSAAPYPAPPAGDITIEFPVEYSLRDSS